jgi:hypothetical protein
MTGMAGRLAKVFLLVGLALAVTASSGAAASPTRAPMLGVVPHKGSIHALALRVATASPQAAAAGPEDLSLKAKPCRPTACWVMRTNTTHAIYWVPSGQSVAAGYESAIDQYLSDVAAASGSQTNVYSVTTQYRDSTGFIANQSTFAGSYVDTDPFPANGCNDTVDSVCLTDQQLQNEIAKVIAAKGWTAGPDSLFILMTPDGVGSCVDGTSPPAGECSTNYYCAYHSSFILNGQPVIYTNQPYAATIANGQCSAGSSPNGNDADSTINLISHEQTEAITDPWGNAWQNAAGDEIGDICTWKFGASLGGTIGLDAYNQAINGHHYWLQQEYSNDGSTCRQHYVGLPANTVRPAVTGVATLGQSLSASQGSWTQEPTSYAYQWLRCSAKGTNCTKISRATTSAHTIVAADGGHTLEAQVRATNSRGTKTADSKHSALVVASPASKNAPRISGRAQVGRRLSATKGSWSGPPRTYGFQWLRCSTGGGSCSTIGGATHASYRLTKHDVGHRLRVRVTAANAVGRATATSRATSRVSAAKP